MIMRYMDKAENTYRVHSFQCHNTNSAAVFSSINEALNFTYLACNYGLTSCTIDWQSTYIIHIAKRYPNFTHLTLPN